MRRCGNGGAGAPYVGGSDRGSVGVKKKTDLLYSVSSSGGGEATGDEGTGYRPAVRGRSGSAAGAENQAAAFVGRLEEASVVWAVAAYRLS